MSRHVVIVAALLSLASQAHAHGGPPLRVGVTADPGVTAVGRLVLAHLREGVGFGVDWRGFSDEAALHASFAAGKTDIAVVVGGANEAPRLAGDCPPEAIARLREDLRQRWGGEVFVIGAPAGSAGCARFALIVSRSVLEDLRFGILGRESARMAAFITPGDVAAVRAAAEREGERGAAAAARAALAAKDHR